MVKIKSSKRGQKLLRVRKLSPWKIDTKNNFLTGLMIRGEQAVHGISKNTKFVEFDQKKYQKDPNPSTIDYLYRLF